MDKNVLWPVTIKNSICVICFTVLAVVFNEWWIVLFSGFFMTDIKTIHQYYRTCDRCGKHGPYASTYNDAIKKAKEAGWIIRKVGDKWDDRCPECRDDL